MNASGAKYVPFFAAHVLTDRRDSFALRLPIGNATGVLKTANDVPIPIT